MRLRGSEPFYQSFLGGDGSHSWTLAIDSQRLIPGNHDEGAERRDEFAADFVVFTAVAVRRTPGGLAPFTESPAADRHRLAQRQRATIAGWPRSRHRPSCW